MTISCNQSRILIVDDESNVLKACSSTLKIHGFNDVQTEVDSRKVLALLESEKFDVIILDLYMPHVSGMELLPQIAELYPETQIVVVTAAYEIERAVSCIKLGAFDYMVKPVENDRLVTTVNKAIEHSFLLQQLRSMRDNLLYKKQEHLAAFDEIITQNSELQKLFQYIEVVARSPQPVLVFGESGTGKELIARALHRLSGCKGDLISVNLAGLDDNMFSDTLFGHRRGAFTGADSAREGLIVKAAGGMLFLDEIGDLSQASQLKLLRLIQEREFYPVGADVPRVSTARIVCATNRDIRALVADGSFRNDLYYRLCTHLIALPPLRQRKDDIPLLLAHFVTQAAEKLGKRSPHYPKELGDLLSTYSFPGNIRELQAFVFDAVARCTTGTLSLEPFKNMIAASNATPVVTPDNAGREDSGLAQQLESIWGHFPTLREAEDTIVQAAMESARDNQGIAASLLGLKRQTLNMRLKTMAQRT
ncbi:MAG: response regulator [Geobacter sp.]|nr:response regulator [Geobacter sp.]